MIVNKDKALQQVLSVYSLNVNFHGPHALQLQTFRPQGCMFECPVQLDWTLDFALDCCQ